MNCTGRWRTYRGIGAGRHGRAEAWVARSAIHGLSHEGGHESALCVKRPSLSPSAAWDRSGTVRRKCGSSSEWGMKRVDGDRRSGGKHNIVSLRTSAGVGGCTTRANTRTMPVESMGPRKNEPSLRRGFVDDLCEGRVINRLNHRVQVGGPSPDKRVGTMSDK
jgi:hypothetical protein